MEHKRLKILLVEDSVADSLILSRLLRERDRSIDVIVLTDGEQAADYLLRRGSHKDVPLPDVVLLDLNLPKKTGFEVLAEMRAEPNLRDVPVFMLTTSASPEDEHRASALGVLAFFSKPAKLDAFERIVDRLITVEFPRISGRGETTSNSENSQKEGGEIPRAAVSLDAFRLLVEAVKDYAIFLLDPHGYILSWNEGAQRTKQYTAAEILGKHFSIFYTQPDIDNAHPQHELELAKLEGRYQEEGWRLRKDGTRFWATVTITAIYDASNTLIGFGKVTRDMTERKMAEERLRESEERFRILVNGVRDYAIFMLDPTGHIVSWNPGAERIKGYKAAEVLGKHFSIFYTAESQAKEQPSHELSVATTTGSYEEEGIRVRKDGSTFWASVVLTALYDKSGKLKGFAKVTRDVTDRKRAEENVRALNLDLERRVQERTKEADDSRALLEVQKEELERSNADLRQFAFVASHDLQEPLRTVVFYLQFLEKQAVEKLNAEERECIDVAVSGALRMRSLVQDLLSYARIERSTDPIPMVDFNRVAQQSIANLEQAVRESGVSIEVTALPSAPANESQMVQVFQNLIGNAITYRDPNRRLQLRIAGAKSDAGWIYSVSDNGIGIKPEYWQKIFVIFQRLHSDREQYPGTGIGLSLCKRILERHGGRIWVESEEGHGSTFFFELPEASA